MITLEGRKGQEQEYVEYRCDKTKRKIRVVMQLSGQFWHIYLVEPGRKGAVRVLPLAYAHKKDALTASAAVADALEVYQEM